MEYAIKIKDHVIDFDEVSHYTPHELNGEYKIFFYFKRSSEYTIIVFKDEKERNLYLKAINGELIETDFDEELEDDIDISEI